MSAPGPCLPRPIGWPGTQHTMCMHAVTIAGAMVHTANCTYMQHLLPAWPAPDACASSALWLCCCSSSGRACSSVATSAWCSSTSSSIALQAEATPLRGPCLRVRCCAVLRRLSEAFLSKTRETWLRWVLDVLLEVLQRIAVHPETTIPMEVHHSGMHVASQLNLVESNTVITQHANKQLSSLKHASVAMYTSFLQNITVYTRETFIVNTYMCTAFGAVLRRH